MSAIPFPPSRHSPEFRHVDASALPLRARVAHFLDVPRSPRTMVATLSAYLLLTCNWPLWRQLAHIGGGAPSLYMPSILLMAILLMCANTAVLTLAAWSRWAKPIWLAVVFAAAVAQHYMLEYRVVMDPGMLANALQTDAGEVRDLLSVTMLWRVAAVVLPASWLLWRVPVRRMAWLANAWRNVALLVALAAVAAITIVASNRTLAPLMRNHMGLRYTMNPVASLYSASKVAAKPLFARQRQLVPITAGTHLGAGYATQSKPPLLLLVVGETARADHFALNGYPRDTTPELAARGVTNWTHATSCGTSTLASVPCMFSSLGKTAFEARSDEHENLMDVLQASGLAVFWLDNQPGGCKGVCDRVPHASAFKGLDAATRKENCDGDECRDDVLLRGIDERIAALPAERRAKGVVLVMHQMGSHGPAYYARSSQDAKRFKPECTTNALADCSHAELINAFDNSIAYTDRFLGKSIDWLKTRQKDYAPAMLYLSDHGESLGEYGLFLHGVPYSFAPDVQKHIPWVMWVSEDMRRRASLSASCLARAHDEPVSHDNLYHTVLGLMDVQTPTYRPSMNALAPCRDGVSSL